LNSMQGIERGVDYGGAMKSSATNYLYNFWPPKPNPNSASWRRTWRHSGMRTGILGGNTECVNGGSSYACHTESENLIEPSELSDSPRAYDSSSRRSARAGRHPANDDGAARAFGGHRRGTPVLNNPGIPSEFLIRTCASGNINLTRT
jgi:hypothetical protein